MAQTKPHTDDQERYADEANANIKKQAFFMKRALDDHNLHEGLKNASNMLFELRTSKLSPQNYYELYMNVTDELRHLEAFIEDDVKKDADSSEQRLSLSELYETVQHAGNIIPRLYLLTTVGSVYIKSDGAPAMEILFDLIEMTKGVQHPMRGLFLRNYLSQISRDKLPDGPPRPDAEQDDDVKESIEFVLQNFSEMNRLWVRMQHQGAVRDRSRREKERQNLRMLVGTNLVRLSQLQSVDKEVYQTKVLPRILEQIVKCKDVIAQEYLMDCIIQVFPDDFHLATLEIFLSAVSKLQSNVNVKDIIIALMNRISNYALESPDNIPTELEMFPIFQKHSSQVVEAKDKMSCKDVLTIQVALMNFATKCYPTRLDYIDNVLEYSSKILAKFSETESPGQTAGQQILKLLTTPLHAVVLQVLELEHYAACITYLEFDYQRNVATEILKQLLKTRTRLETHQMVERMLTFVGPVIKDPDDYQRSDDSKFEFEEEQHLLARFVHSIKSDNTDQQFKSLLIARKAFEQGGPERIIHTYPSLVFAALSLIRRVFAKEREKEEITYKSKRMFQYAHEIATTLSSHSPNIALRLFLQGALAADECQYEPIAYEFVVKALLIYEEEISDSTDQARAINQITATIQATNSFDTDNYETLSTKATQHSSKLLKKPAQARSVYTSAHLFWHSSEDGFKTAKTVVHCLQRSLKIANVIIDDVQKVQIFIEILNKYIYFFERNCETIRAEYLTNLISLIEEHFNGIDQDSADTDAVAKAQAHFRATLDYIKTKQQSTDEEEEDDEEGSAMRFQQISL